jgi:ribosome-associated protein
MPSSDTHLAVTRSLQIPLAEIDFQYSRSSGPGGQNVNKLNTRVQMWWDATNSLSLREDVRERFLKQNAGRLTKEGVLQLECQQFRTQLANRTHCLDELAELVRKALVRPKKRRPTRPTKGSKERRLKGKKERSQKKESRRMKPRLD